MPKASTGSTPAATGKVRGTVTAYNLFVRTCREELRRKYPQLNVDYTVIARKCSERWKGMNEQEKKRFYDTADAQRRFAAAQQVILTSPSVPTKKLVKKKEKKIKDPLAPKKPLSAYFLFCADERPKLLNTQTGENLRSSGMSVSEAARELGARWKSVPAELKSRYEQMASEQKDLYRNEMANYKTQTSMVNEDFGNALPSFLLDSSFDLSDTPNEFELIPSTAEQM